MSARTNTRGSPFPQPPLVSGENSPLLGGEHEDITTHTTIEPTLVEGRQDEGNIIDERDERYHLKKGLLWRLYISHFLSTWNMRAYEYTVIILFAAAYSSLLVTSIRGVITNTSTLLLGPLIGRWVDRNARNFSPLKVTIVVQRVTILIGCILWMVLSKFTSPLHLNSSSHNLEDNPNNTSGNTSTNNLNYKYKYNSKTTIISLLILIGIIERIAAVANNLVMERDWVPTISSETETETETDNNRPSLHHLNAVMKRIDLVSKLVAPVFVEWVVRLLRSIQVSSGDGDSRRMEQGLPVVIGIMNLASIGFELGLAKSAWDRCDLLRLDREGKGSFLLRPSGGDEEQHGLMALPAETTAITEDNNTTPEPKENTSSLKLYFSNDAWLPSLSGALQSFSVLALSGPMITYLYMQGLSSYVFWALLGVAIIELLSTVIFPAAANFLNQRARGATVTPTSTSTSTASASGPLLSRVFLPQDPMATIGLLGITLQLALLIPAFLVLVILPLNSTHSTISTSQSSTASTNPNPNSKTRILQITTSLIALSSLGRWIHALSAQQIVQTRVPPRQRVEFSGVETTFVSGAEIARWGVCAVFPRVEMFNTVLAPMGLGSVFVIWGLFFVWVVKFRAIVGREDRARVSI